MPFQKMRFEERVTADLLREMKKRVLAKRRQRAYNKQTGSRKKTVSAASQESPPIDGHGT